MLDQSFWQESEVANLKAKLKAVDINSQGIPSDLIDLWSEDQHEKWKREAIKASKRKVSEGFADFWGENQQLWEDTVNRVTKSG